MSTCATSDLADRLVASVSQAGSARTSPRLYRTLVRLLARGEPVTIAQLAIAIGQPVDGSDFCNPGRFFVTPDAARIWQAKASRNERGAGGRCLPSEPVPQRYAARRLRPARVLYVLTKQPDRHAQQIVVASSCKHR